MRHTIDINVIPVITHYTIAAKILLGITTVYFARRIITHRSRRTPRRLRIIEMPYQHPIVTPSMFIELNLDVDSVSLTVQAEWNPVAGRKGHENESIALQNVRYTLHALTPESEDKVKEWLNRVEKICPMYNLFKDTQTFEHKIVRGSFKR